MRQGLQSQSESYSDRLIANLVNTYRAKLIRQERNAGKQLTSYYIQNLGRVELVTADMNECGIISDCILRVKNPLPKAIDTNGKSLITNVSTMDHSMDFSRTTSQRAKYDLKNTWIGNFAKYYETGEYLYVIKPPTKILKYINIQGVFEDPQAAKSFNTCSNVTDCYEGYDYEYPLSTTLVDTIVKLVIEEIKDGVVKSQDTTTDNKDN